MNIKEQELRIKLNEYATMLLDILQEKNTNLAIVKVISNDDKTVDKIIS